MTDAESVPVSEMGIGDDDGTLTFRLTTGEIYETWGGMETPEF